MLEAKVDITTYCGEVDEAKLNNWLKQLKVYFQMHGVVNDVDIIYFARINMGWYALVWWESYVETLSHEHLSEVSSWIEFKNLLRDKFYPLGYYNKQWMKW